jgi:hypothetical protein
MQQCASKRRDVEARGQDDPFAVVATISAVDSTQEQTIQFWLTRDDRSQLCDPFHLLRPGNGWWEQTSTEDALDPHEPLPRNICFCAFNTATVSAFVFVSGDSDCRERFCAVLRTAQLPLAISLVFAAMCAT